MKKLILSLLLLVLCLSLAACDNGTEKMDFSAVYVQLENENYVAAMEMVAKIQRGTSGAEPGIDQDTAQKYAATYDQLDAALQKQEYDGAAKQIAKMAFDHYLRMAEGSAPAWDRITAGWPEKESNPGFDKQSFVYFYEDGRFGWTRNNEEMWWIIREYTPTQLDIEVYYADTLESAGFIRINTDDDTLRFMLQERNGGSTSELNCVREWLLTGAYNGQWQTPEIKESFPAYFTLEDGEVVIDDVRYPITFERGEGCVYGEDGALLYTLILCMGEKSDYIEVYNSWTRCEYYAAGDYDHMLMVSEYEKALHILPMLKDSENGLNYNGDERSRQEWFAYIYQVMENAKGYGESARILANFSQLVNMLVGITTIPDEFNYHMEDYKYDASGRLIYARDETLTLFIYGTPEVMIKVGTEEDYYETVPHQYYFEYNLRGRISRILHKNWDELVSTITPTYDAQGNIKRLDIRMANGETRGANFTYDSDMMPRAMGSQIFLSGDSVLRSISYGEYFLDLAWTPDFDGYQLAGISGWITLHGQDASYSEEYTYDNGRMTRKFITITTGNEDFSLVNTEEYIYTYDGEGKIASEQRTVTSGDNSWIDVLYYMYQDILFYDYDAQDNDQENQEQINKIIQYEKALNVLSLLENCNGVLVYEGEEKTQQQWLAFVRQAMIDAAGYGESDRILSNFSELENVLTGISTDPNGGDYYKEYRYDSAGRMIFANDNDYTKFIYGALEVASTPYYFFEYDEQGRVSRILHKNGEELFATITLTHDDRGNVKRLDILMAGGEERYAGFTYEYDMMPRTMQEEDGWYEDDWYEDDWYEEPVDMDNVLRTISFGDQFMDFAWTPDFDGYTYSGLHAFLGWGEEGYAYQEDVTYDDQERVASKTIWINDVVTTVCTYTYDADGALISETYTTDGKTVTYYYIYQNVLVYDFTT